MKFINNANCYCSLASLREVVSRPLNTKIYVCSVPIKWRNVCIEPENILLHTLNYCCILAILIICIIYLVNILNIRLNIFNICTMYKQDNHYIS